MSKIALTPNASGTGTLTIAAPNTSTDRTLTLPDSTGTIDTLQRAGNVLQVVQTYIADTGVISTTSTSFVGSGVTVSITPTSTSNFIVIQMFNPMVDHSGAGSVSGQMYVNGSAMTGAGGYHLGYQDSSARYSSWCFAGKYSPASLATLTFEPYFKSDNGGSARFSHDDSSISLIAMEIAA